MVYFYLLFQNELTEKELHTSDQENEIQECRALLDEVNSRVDEKDFVIEEKDSQIMEVEERIETIKKEREQQGIVKSTVFYTISIAPILRVQKGTWRAINIHLSSTDFSSVRNGTTMY